MQRFYSLFATISSLSGFVPDRARVRGLATLEVRLDGLRLEHLGHAFRGFADVISVEVMTPKTGVEALLGGQFGVGCVERILLYLDLGMAELAVVRRDCNPSAAVFQMTALALVRAKLFSRVGKPRLVEAEHRMTIIRSLVACKAVQVFYVLHAEIDDAGSQPEDVAGVGL